MHSFWTRLIWHCRALFDERLDIGDLFKRDRTSSASASRWPPDTVSHQIFASLVHFEKPFPGSSVVHEDLKFCILILTVIIGTPGNAFMTYVIWKTPQLRSRTNILLAWLTIADILVLRTVNLFVAIHQFIIFVLSSNSCDYIKLVGASYTIVKIANQAAIGIMISYAIDRYVAIVYPFLYETLITERWAKMSVTVSWVYGFTIGFMYTIYLLTRVDLSSCNTPYSMIMQCVSDNGSYVVASVTMIILYGRIFKIAMEQRSKIDIDVLSSSGGGQQVSQRSGALRQELKAVRTTVLILGSFIILWFPYEVGKFLQTIRNTVHIRRCWSMLECPSGWPNMPSVGSSMGCPAGNSRMLSDGFWKALDSAY